MPKLRLALALLGTLAIAMPAFAADWHAKVKEVRIRMARYEKFKAYMEKALGAPVKIFTASDYAGVIQAMAARQIEFAFLGSSAYAQLWKETNGAAEPLLTSLQEDGSTGYYSVVVVRCDSPYKRLEDLKGKTLAFADPNSTSGFQVPSFHLRRNGFDPAKYFSATPFSGSHENGVMGVVNRSYDAAATYITDEQRGIPQRMVEKGMIPANTACWIWTSPEITSGPFTARKDLPDDLKKAAMEAVEQIPEKDQTAFQAMAPGNKGYKRVDHARYEWVIEMQDELIMARRARGS
jgi:phosphonate transport system substrate-binding protein